MTGFAHTKSQEAALTTLLGGGGSIGHAIEIGCLEMLTNGFGGFGTAHCALHAATTTQDKAQRQKTKPCRRLAERYEGGFLRHRFDYIYYIGVGEA